MKAKKPNYRKVYAVRFEDLELKYCAFYTNKIDADKGKTEFKRKFNKDALIDQFDVPYTKKGFIDFVDEYGVKYRTK